MSDFLYSARTHLAAPLVQILHRFPGLAETDDSELSDHWGTLSIVRPAHEHGALIQSDTHTTVVLGNPVVTLPGIEAAPLFVGERRRLLHDALASSTFSPVGVLDGAYLALSIAHNSGTICVVTDRFNFIPAFRAVDTDGSLVLGTHPDAVAHAAGRANNVDLISAADLIANLTCTFPFTIYKGVVQLEPGSVHVIPRVSETHPPRSYWLPREINTFDSLSDAARELERAFRTSVHASCEGSERVGVLLSGGESSRAVLAAVPKSTKADTFIYAEGENREVRTARAAASAYATRLHVGLRDADHYLTGFEKTTAMLGSGHLFVDVHGLWLHKSLGLDALPLVLGGLSADALLKATHAHRKLPAKFRTSRLPHLREDLLREVDFRRNDFRQRMLELRPNSADEWLQLWPFSMRRHGGSLAGNRRLFRVHEAYHANAVLDVAAAAPAEWKLRGRLFHRAFRLLFKDSRFVTNAEYRFPYYNRFGNALLVPPLIVARGLRAVATRELRVAYGTEASWSPVADAPVTRANERRLLRGEAPLAALLDARRESLREELAQWAPLSRLMLVQLAYVTRGE